MSAPVAEKIVCVDRPSWLEARTRGIGASDAAAVLGVSPWRSPLAVYAEKLGVADLVAVETEAMRWGNLLEPVIAECYQQETGRELVDHGRFTLFRSSVHAFMFATLDREIVGDPRGPGVLEIKTANARATDDWADEPPLIYQIQLQHQLAVKGYAWGSLAVLLGGQKFLWMDMARNDAFIASLIEHEAAFWDRLGRLEPPPADASESSREALARLYPKDDGETIALPPDAADWDDRLVAAKAQLATWTAVKDDLEVRIKAALGSASYGALPGGGRYSWKTSERAGYTVEPTVVRALRRLKT